MHELSLVASIFEVVEKAAREHHAKAVTKVKIRVGELAGVVPDLLQSAFESYRKGTIAEGATLEVEYVPLKFRCKSCGGDLSAERPGEPCGKCGARNVEIVEGRELVVDSIEMEIGGEPGPPP